MKPQHSLTVALGPRSYPILIGSGLLQESELLARHLACKQVALVSNATLMPMYGAHLEKRLAAAGINVVPIALPDGEAFKTRESLDHIHDVLLDAQFDRKSAVIALGGGVVGDLAGFAAATYQRGIPFVQVPTTLLAQVDSSIGGKTAINHPRGKNMIGAFHQPKLVLIDTETLATLPERELKAGLAEVIKYGLIRDPAFFAWLEGNLDALLARKAEALDQAIYESCRNKAEVVAADELETGERALLNLGHTFGHAIEGALGFGVWLHGEAVAAGMVMAARMSQRIGSISAEDVSRVERIIRRAGLPVEGPALAAETLLGYMDHDKKNESGVIRLILLKGIGKAYMDATVPRADLLQFLRDHATPVQA